MTKRKLFENLSERSKDERSRVLARAEPLEKLLRSAEKAARKNANPAIAKVLLLLRKKGEGWAAETMLLSQQAQMREQLSNESSLMLKTRLGLSKRRYTGIEKFAKQVHGIKLLQPWASMVEYRNQIIPRHSSPTCDNGYLSIKVTLRDMVTCDVTRILELDEVNSKVLELPDRADNKTIDCTMHVTSGVDSATGFSHYNQAEILKKDDSLLSEHVMSLMLLTEGGETMWTNPNPQSDTFCRAKSMSWVKETDSITRKIFAEFFQELEDINRNPILVSANGKELRVKISGMYTMIDGKAANAIANNRDTHACPLCVAGTDARLGPAFFHSRLNVVEWVIRVSAQKLVEGHPPQSNAAVKAKAREIADRLEEFFKMSINRPKIGGSGSSNNGNMARRLLADPENFAKILGISQLLVENLRLISSLALSSRQLDAEKVKQLYVEIEDQIASEFPFVKRLPPSLHKYSHLPEFIEKLVSIK